jgi:hypothetical protein
VETVAWVGAIETAIAILYIAIVGQRSIAQMIDDRRKQRPNVKSTDDEPSIEVARPLPRFHSRVLSVQRLGDYLEYIWREPAEALYYFAKGLMIGFALLGVTTILLLLVGAIILSIPAYFSGSKDLAGLAGTMAAQGGFGLFVVPFVTLMLILGTFGADWVRKAVIEEREIQANKVKEAKEAEQKARATRRRKTTS